LRQRRDYTGSYDTVKLFVQPLRAAREQAERALVRFETPPGQQSQLDWGQARVTFRHATAVRHIFVLTLGFSRRSYYEPCPNERLPQFLDAHEHAFEHFGATRASTSTIGRAPCAMGRLTGRSSGIRPSRRLPTTGVSSRGSAAPNGGRRRARSRRA
jgi:transposase